MNVSGQELMLIVRQPITFFWNVLISRLLIIVRQHILRHVVIKPEERAKPSVAQCPGRWESAACTNDSDRFSET